MRSKNSKELDEFENQINNQEVNSQIKYRVDRALEASIKYEYLVETFGEDKVNSIVKDSIDLFDVDFYNEVKEKLESSKDV